MTSANSYVSHPWINPGTIEVREYQENAVKTALTGNTLCVLPTGLGKTNIAALVAAERLKLAFEEKKNLPKSITTSDGFTSADKFADVDNSKVMFLAPTKPLVSQHKRSFERVLKIGPDEIIAVTGTDKPIDRRRHYRHGDVIIATPQTIGNDLKSRILDLTAFTLLVVDEAHRSVGNYAYVSIAKQYMRTAKDPLILALTASPGSSRAKIDQIKKALSIANVSIRSREDEDVQPYVQPLKQVFVEVDLPQDFRNVLTLFDKLRIENVNKIFSLGLSEIGVNIPPRLNKIEILRLQAFLSTKKHWKSFAAMSILAEIMKLDHAALLLETQSLYSLEKYITRLRDDDSKATARLLVNPTFKVICDKMLELSENDIDNPKLAKLVALVEKEIIQDHRFIVFTQYRDTVDRIIQVLKRVPGAQPAAFIGQANKSGAKTGSSAARGMSQKEQIEIIKEFKSGFYNILVCTSIGEEGLDIAETDTVVFYEPIPSEIRSIQRSGRTARTRPGKVVFLIAKNTRDQAYFWSAHHKQKKMMRMLYDMQEKNPGLNAFTKQ